MPLFIFRMRVCLLVFLFCFALHTYAQDSTVIYKASVMAAGATDQTPFWQRANQNGSIPIDGNFGVLNVGLYKIYNPNNPRLFQWRGGIEAIGSYGKSGNVFFSDLFVAGKMGIFELSAGQQKNVTGLMDTTLTSGSLSVAGNARPHPRIQISIPEYQSLYFTNNFLSFKFAYSDGYLGGSNINYGSSRHISRNYFHQKSLYFRLGQKSDRLHIYTGINHQALWGGEDKIMPLYNLQPAKAYWYTVSGKTLDHRKVGTHFGTIDLGGEWRGKTWSYFVYRQNIFETGSLFKAINFEDGLNGISVKRNKPLPAGATYFAFNSFLLEVVGTHNQINNSPLSGLAIFQSGNYYNSYIYQRGWSYYGEGMGTPLASATNATNSDLPRNGSEFTNNNRFWAFHTGLTATWLKMKLTFKGTYSRNSGSFLSPYDSVKQQASIMLGAEKNLKILKGCSIFSNISSDIGDLYPNSTGLLLGVRKSGFLD
jgi:hypothetical protein